MYSDSSYHAGLINFMKSRPNWIKWNQRLNNKLDTSSFLKHSLHVLPHFLWPLHCFINSSDPSLNRTCLLSFHPCTVLITDAKHCSKHPLTFLTHHADLSHTNDCWLCWSNIGKINYYYQKLIEKEYRYKNNCFLLKNWIKRINVWTYLMIKLMIEMFQSFRSKSIFLEFVEM